ncbi:MAG: MoaD/ThiS family protein [Firmicutes bacterium]|nr:MoaD/ThiS family protein [Bacillota bacterium]
MRFSLHTVGIPVPNPPRGELELDLEEATVGGFLATLGKAYPQLARYASEELMRREEVALLVNGRNALSLGGMATPLSGGEQILLTVRVVGG